MKELFLTVFGSHLYGTNTPESDQDFKGISIPSAYDIVMQKAFRSAHQSTKSQSEAKNTKNDVESEIFSLHQFIKLCDEGQTVALDMLFAPRNQWLKTSPEWEFLVANRDKLIHRKATAFIGYCFTQAAKYGVKGSRVNAVKKVIGVLNSLAIKDAVKLHQVWGILLNTLEGEEHIKFIELDSPDGSAAGGTKKVRGIEVCDRKLQEGVAIRYALDVMKRLDERYGVRARMASTNAGVDWKAMSHALRVCFEAQELLTTGNITFPLATAEFLTEVKQGKISYVQVAQALEWEMEEVKRCELISTLPDNIDRAFWDKWVFETYVKHINDKKE